MDSVPQTLTKHNTQIRPNLWLTESGAVVGYGPMLAHNGFAYCFTCGTDECQHVQRLDEAWIAGQDSVEIIGRWCTACQFGRHCGGCICCSNEAIPFDGRPGDGCDESTESARLGLPVEWF